MDISRVLTAAFGGAPLSNTVSPRALSIFQNVRCLCGGGITLRLILSQSGQGVYFFAGHCEGEDPEARQFAIMVFNGPERNHLNTYFSDLGLDVLVVRSLDEIEGRRVTDLYIVNFSDDSCGQGVEKIRQEIMNGALKRVTLIESQTARPVLVPEVFNEALILDGECKSDPVDRYMASTKWIRATNLLLLSIEVFISGPAFIWDATMIYHRLLTNNYIRIRH
jgi:hypothetical protein